MDDSTESWLDIVEYSRYADKSISTIRRYIKSGKVVHKLIDGKFYIQVVGECRNKPTGPSTIEAEKMQRENETLKKHIRAIEEEKADLQMLVHLYEDRAMPSDTTSRIDR